MNIDLYHRIVETAGKDFKNPAIVTKVVEAFMKDPSPTKAMVECELGPAAIYRWMKILKEAGVMRENNTIAFQAQKKFPIPTYINQGNLPPAENCPTVHLLAYLSKFKDTDIIPGFNKNRIEIANSFKSNLETDLDASTTLVYTTYENLCIYALINKDFTVMKTFNGILDPKLGVTT